MTLPQQGKENNNLKKTLCAEQQLAHLSVSPLLPNIHIHILRVAEVIKRSVGTLIPLCNEHTVFCDLTSWY